MIKHLRVQAANRLCIGISNIYLDDFVISQRSLLLDQATIVFLLFKTGLRRATIVLERATYCYRTGYAGLPILEADMISLL